MQYTDLEYQNNIMLLLKLIYITSIPFITFTATVWGAQRLELISNTALNTVPNSPN